MKKKLMYSLIVVTFAIVLYLALSNGAVIMGILKKLFSVIAPLVLGLAIAFIINVPLKMFEKLWIKIFKKAKTNRNEIFKRPVCLTLSILLFAVAIFAVMFMIIPELIRTGENLVANLPEYIAGLNEWWQKVVDFAAKRGAELPQISLSADKISSTVGSFINDNKNTVFDKTIGITTSIFSGVVDTVLAISFSIYVLAQKERIANRIRRITYAFVKEERADKLVDFARRTNHTFTNFVTGQFIEAVIIGVLCFIGMKIFRMPYASIVSVMVGVTALIPMFGAFIGTGVGAFLILLVSPIKALWFIVFIIVLQQLEGNLIYPKVVGNSVGLPGILVLVAVTIGGKLFGVGGMLIGVPLCAVFYCLLKEIVEARLEKKKANNEIAELEETEAEVEGDS